MEGVSMDEVVLDIIPKFFQVGFYKKEYYDVVITNRRLVLLWLGESFKTWMLRADAGQNKRDDLALLDTEKIINYSENNILIDYKDIKTIELGKRTILKNASIIMNTKDGEYKLYTDDRKIDMDQIFSIFNDIFQAKVSFQ